MRNDRETRNGVPELAGYEAQEDGGLAIYLGREMEDDTIAPDFRHYMVCFDIGSLRYYCYLEPINIDEALGLFFRNHPHITYEMIVDHVEV